MGLVRQTLMPGVLQNSKAPKSLERVEWFGWLFACSYQHFVRYSLKLQNMFFWVDIVSIGSQPIRLSNVLCLINLKTMWGVRLVFCFHWSYKTYAILGCDPKILLANQFAECFTFGFLIIIMPLSIAT